MQMKVELYISIDRFHEKKCLFDVIHKKHKPKTHSDVQVSKLQM